MNALCHVRQRFIEFFNLFFVNRAIAPSNFFFRQILRGFFAIAMTFSIPLDLFFLHKMTARRILSVPHDLHCIPTFAFPVVHRPSFASLASNCMQLQFALGTSLQNARKGRSEREKGREETDHLDWQSNANDEEFNGKKKTAPLQGLAAADHCTVGQNSLILRHRIIHFPMSAGVSE